MLNEGLSLMAVGMGTVFCFLGLLVGLMHLAAAAFSRWPDEALPAPAAVGADPRIAIAIAIAAIEKERS